MEGNQVEVNGFSGQAVKLLFQIWHDNGRIQEVTVELTSWLDRFPDFRELIEASQREGLVEAWPSTTCETDQFGLPVKGAPVHERYNIRFTPKGLLRMREVARERRQVHRQVTVDGQATDLRTMVGRMLFTTSVGNLADACRIWLTDLQNEGKATARRKVRILLSRAIGIRGEELAAHNPDLKEQIMEALCNSEKERKWVLRESERRARDEEESPQRRF